ncbi:MAG: ComEA family DNA-binding protein [Eggerthellaceae bacterium]|nr:ComEA family DNA-binding protein [Eggerthellaceae bacterium]
MDLDTLEKMHSKLSLADLGKPALIGIAILVIMVAVLAGRNLIGTATATEFELSSDASSIEETASDGGSHKTETLFVHVSGCVANPGLYELEEGSRLASAIEAAGGFTEDAACDSVNLARRLEDGEMVVVLPMSAGSGANEEIPEVKTASSLININTATAEELEQLPGIGPSTAQKIVSDRMANGSFKSPDDLKRVTGIGDKKFETISALICV